MSGIKQHRDGDYILEEILDEKMKDNPNVKYIRILQQMLDRIHKKYKSVK